MAEIDGDSARRPAHAAPQILPPLREDLQLHEAAPNVDGSPAWVIQDPVNNAFYRIGWLEFELLSRWHLETPVAVLAAARAETLLDPTDDELHELLGFLHGHQLLALHDAGHTDYLIKLYRHGRLSRARWLLHHYLFFRIPLWHPDRFLQALMPLAHRLYRSSTAWILLAFCLAGAILAARQWDVFAASFVETLSPGGLAGYLVALAIAKSIHELAHAITATRHGVRVAHMGVAFLVLWPMLYTDTGESWRLKDRRQRLAIASAGIISELALAGLATLAWSLTAPGDLRQAYFFLATTAWLISLGLNASPFMRFDGYFVLSDLLDIPNLHERSFALARTWLRNRLWGWDDPDPEPFSPHRRRFLIAFAIITWLYRLVVFMGIAVAVYLIFFKLLGIFLFLVEIAWFVARPVYNEIKVWYMRRGEILPSRRVIAGASLGGLLLISLVPWNMHVAAEAWAHAQYSHALYSPLPARIVSLPTNDRRHEVKANSAIFVLEQPENLIRASLAIVGADALDRQLAGLAGLPEGEEKRPLLEQMRAMKQAEAMAQSEESQRLQLRTPFSGLLMDVDTQLHPGVWVTSQQLLAVMVQPNAWQVEAFVTQSDIPRIAVGDRARFYPEDDRLFPLRGEVTEIETTRVATLSHPLLSSRHGGNIAVLPDSAGLTPRDAIFRVRIRLDRASDRIAVRRGSVMIDAAPRSWLIEAAKSVLVVLIREASF
ncbi:MAG: HlyD family efflux transporter periplasmic adaptor subunit [Sulfuritalea sp.]|nr:HlyD family efflux transporter periplasmic adaptor subunit [Sulfuritalea sp.]MDP1981094.1 HlyD family efflux transporter periplasmic adaptor subunit [Sulfuritalea sp.]